ncbi:hypothetical protein [Mycobacterium servetii]|uniref:Glycosyltransferase RgtA/B/C/D-like domain-containing protein n=1 Tax=Mycobacterium servetii TaxID=3237418 RepID=A0ABV4C5I6_9MYCO
MSRPLGMRRRGVSTLRERLSAPAARERQSSSDPGSTLAAAGSPSRFIRFIQLFGLPRTFAAIVVLSALVVVPTLWVGFYADDYSLIVEIEHKVPSLAHRSPLDLYHFASDRTEVERQIRDGPTPWFSDPGSTMHFFRPLTSLVFALDHSLWGYHAAGYHITSVLLYVGLVLCVGLFFHIALGVRRPGSSAVTATLATLLFAVDPHHVMPVDWISSRHFVVAAIPAVLGLAAHVRFVREGWGPGLWLGPIGVVAALLGSEAGVGAVVYWLAFDALGPAPPERSSPRSRLFSSMPIGAITAVYLGIYTFFGFGSRGGAYFDPTKEPLGFLRAAAQRVPMLVGIALSGIPEAAQAVPPVLFIVLGFGAALIAFALYRLARPAVCDAEQAALRWLLPGAVFALVLTAGPPSARLMLLPSIASALFVAILIYRGSQQLAAARPQSTLSAGRWFLVGVHLVLAPVVFVVATTQLADDARGESDAFVGAEFDHSATHHVIVLAAPDMEAFYAGTVAQALQPQAVSGWHILSIADSDHRFTRTGVASFRLDVVGGAHGTNAWDSLRDAPRVSRHVELTGAALTVRTVEGRLPTSLDVTVDVPLDSPSLAFVIWRNGRLVRFVPPPVGVSVEVPGGHGA